MSRVCLKYQHHLPLLENIRMYKLHYLSLLIVILFTTACGGNSKTGATATADTTANTTSKQIYTRTLLIFGDSLTAGYGLEDPQTESYPSVLQTMIDAAHQPYQVINGGLSGETSAGGVSRIDWLIKQKKIDVFILELGANDGLRGLSPADTEKNLQTIIDKVKARFPDVKLVLTGMMVPPNMGAGYSAAFKAIFPALAKKNNMAFVPFLLQNVAGIKELNQADGIHPTAKGAKIVADNVWKVLKGVL